MPAKAGIHTLVVEPALALYWILALRGNDILPLLPQNETPPCSWVRFILGANCVMPAQAGIHAFLGVLARLRTGFPLARE